MLCVSSSVYHGLVQYVVYDYDINIFKPSGLFHPYQKDEPISNFRGAGWYFSFLLKF